MQELCASVFVLFVLLSMCVCLYVVHATWTSQGHIYAKAHEDSTAFVHVQAVMTGQPFKGHTIHATCKELIILGAL